jgi:predicted RNA polymerase sigma factor
MLISSGVGWSGRDALNLAAMMTRRSLAAMSAVDGWALLAYQGAQSRWSARGHAAGVPGPDRSPRELAAASLTPPSATLAAPPEEDLAARRDDTLDLLFLCCDPALSQPAQTALTLRAIGGLTTSQIARAFLVPETTMAQRITRAKQRLADRGLAGSELTAAERAQRLPAVLEILYLIFNEGYTATSGTDLYRVDLTQEAIRLTRALRESLPSDGEVAGLLALMLLTDARRPARTGPDGALIPLAEQDRGRCNGHAQRTRR